MAPKSDKGKGKASAKRAGSTPEGEPSSTRRRHNSPPASSARANPISSTGGLEPEGGGSSRQQYRAILPAPALAPASAPHGGTALNLQDIGRSLAESTASTVTINPTSSAHATETQSSGSGSKGKGKEVASQSTHKQPTTRAGRRALAAAKAATRLAAGKTTATRAEKAAHKEAVEAEWSPELLRQSDIVRWNIRSATKWKVSEALGGQKTVDEVEELMIVRARVKGEPTALPWTPEAKRTATDKKFLGKIDEEVALEMRRGIEDIKSYWVEMDTWVNDLEE